MKKDLHATSTNPSAHPSGHVAVMIDFENLVYGLRDVFGEERVAELLNLEGLFGLAGEYGPVATSRAYGDWRFKEVNQHQVMLYRAGVDLVHVFGRGGGIGGKNAADVQMATDAIEAIWTLPHVQTFVIVSGDRDFLPVLKTLRRYGKTVVGIAPDSLASSTLASLCDRFLEWSSLTALNLGGAAPRAVTTPGSEDVDLALVKQTIVQLLAPRAADGMKGAMLRPLLRQHHPTFDESKFGFHSLGAFLESIPDAVRVQRDATGGDIMLWPAAATAVGKTPAPAPQLTMLRRSGLGELRFEPDAGRRRAILGRLHASILAAKGADGGFTWQDATERFNAAGAPLSATVLSKYFLLLLKGRCFRMDEAAAEPMRTRKLRLAEDVASQGDFVARYETSVCFRSEDKGPGPISLEAVLTLLGLPPAEQAYAAKILQRIADLRAQAPQQAPGR